MTDITTLLKEESGFIPIERKIEKRERKNVGEISDAERRFRKQIKTIFLNQDEILFGKPVDFDLTKLADFFNRLNKIFYEFIPDCQVIESMNIKRGGKNESYKTLDLHIAPYKETRIIGIQQRYQSKRHDERYNPEEQYKVDIENVSIDQDRDIKYSIFNVLNSDKGDEPPFHRILLYNIPFSRMREIQKVEDKGKRQERVEMCKAESLY